MTWFDTARFGMFIHWGHSSQQGIELSWPMVGGNAALPETNMSVEDYQSSAATFNPENWDPVALARTAKSLGMQYAVLTTKHHDGYAMFHTKTSDFGVEHSPYGRDIVREYVDAFRAEGLRVGPLLLAASTGTTRTTRHSQTRTNRTASAVLARRHRTSGSASSPICSSRSASC